MEGVDKDWWGKNIKQQRVCVCVHVCISGGRGMHRDTELEIIELSFEQS